MLNSAERTMFRQRMPSNRLICNIVDELITDCVKLEIAVDYNVALLAVNLFSLDPKYGISQDIGVVADRKSTDLLIRKCISLFSGKMIDILKFSLFIHGPSTGNNTTISIIINWIHNLFLWCMWKWNEWPCKFWMAGLCWTSH